MLLGWANALNRSNPAFEQAQSLLEAEESVIGRVIRRANVSDLTPLEPQERELPRWNRGACRFGSGDFHVALRVWVGLTLASP